MTRGERRGDGGGRSWVVAATYATGFEADVAVARLEREGILAVRRGNDIVGLFGPGFEGASARGMSVLVPDDEVEEARKVLEDREH